MRMAPSCGGHIIGIVSGGFNGGHIIGIGREGSNDNFTPPYANTLSLPTTANNGFSSENAIVFSSRLAESSSFTSSKLV